MGNNDATEHEEEEHNRPENKLVIPLPCVQKPMMLDKDLLPPKLWFLLYFAGLSCIAPYYSVFYKSIGLKSEQIGILGATRPFIQSIGGPINGLIADKTQKHKVMLFSGILLSVFLRFSMLFAGDSFVFILILLIAAEFVGASVTPLLDNSVLDILGPDRRSSYGKQRMFGSIGWGTAAFTVGSLVTHFHSTDIFFYSHLIIGLIFFAAIAKFPVAPSGGASAFWSNLGIFCYSVDTAMFFLIMFIMGLSVGIYFNFLFVYLRDLGAGEQLMGLVLLTNSASELVFMFFSGAIIDKIGSRSCLYLALVGYALRIFNYSIIPTAWLVLPGELLHGVTWGLAWSAGVHYARSISPPGLGATTQGLVGGVIGLGNGCGAFIGGFLYDKKGAIFTFRATAGLSLVALGMFALSAAFSSSYKHYKKLHSSGHEELQHHDNVEEHENHLEMEDHSNDKDKLIPKTESPNGNGELEHSDDEEQ